MRYPVFSSPSPSNSLLSLRPPTSDDTYIEHCGEEEEEKEQARNPEEVRRGRPRERGMVDEFLVCVDRLIASACFGPANGVATTAGGGDGGMEGRTVSAAAGVDGGCVLPTQQMDGGVGEEGCSKKKRKRKRSGSGRDTECRICQEEGDEADMEAPCACSGTLKYAHRRCIQKWCNKKGNITCEICNQVYAPNYSIPPGRSNSSSVLIGIRQGIEQQIDIHDPRFLAITSAEGEYDDYSTAHNNGIACCRTVALILMLLLLIRHAIMVTRDSIIAEYASALSNVSFLQLVSILLPCYVVVHSCYIVQNRQRRQAYFRQVWG